MVVGFGAEKVLLENDDLSYYGRVLIRALVVAHPDNYYILYTPKNITKTNKKLMTLLNDDSVRVKFPRSHVHNKQGWYTGKGIYASSKNHGINVFHGIDEQLPRGFKNSHIPTLLTLTDPTFEHCGWWQGWLRRRRAHKAAGMAKRVITLTQSARQEVIDHYPVNADDVDVVHLCYHESCDEESSGSMTDVMRTKYHLPEKFILYKGRLNSEDDVEDVLTLLHQLDDHGISLVVVGYRTDHYDDKLKDFAQQQHVFHRFRQIDKLHHSDMTTVVRMAQAVVIPNTSRVRDLYKLINAQRCGAVVLCRDSKDAREYGGDGALYFTTPEDGASQLNHILGNDSDREALLQLGRDNSDKFMPQVIGDQMMHIYRSVLMHRRLYK